jgi:hypothetical protein
MNTAKPLGYIAYEGPSAIDGQPIVVIVTGLGKSTNRKTGSMIQTFILRQDVHPLEALRSGQDESICGQCEHRPVLVRAGNGKAPCYVDVSRAPAAVWRAYRRGRYVKAAPWVIARAIAGRVLRIGTYGDPAAAPVEMWQSMVVYVAGWTGYTHQWRTLGREWQLLVMASADSTQDRADAKLAGWRTFRVSIGVERQDGEITCPASKEAGARVTCIDCRLCRGAQLAARDIVIADHALGHKRRVIQLAAA